MNDNPNKTNTEPTAKETNLPKKNSQSRKYQLTINNPLEAEIDSPDNSGKKIKCPFTHDEIKKRIKKLTSIVYWCMSDEIGLEEGTPHTHIYFVSRSAIRFSTVKNQFPTAHIESAYGDGKTCRDYVKKSGKWENSKKHGTSIDGTFEEYGEIPANEKIGTRGELQYIYDMIESGLTTAEIIKIFPESIRFLDKIEHAKQILVENEYKETFRNLSVTYIYGKTETGKTRSVMEQYGYGSVFRVTDYEHPFDGYRSTEHSVLVFEEFRSSLRIQDMLNYLDGYPCELKARYRNKMATYLYCYIISNVPLSEQYPSIQKESPDTWEAFLRRIQKIIHYKSKDEIITYDSVEKYFRREESFYAIDTTETPFYNPSE